MADNQLIFSSAPLPDELPVVLVFGEDDDTPPEPIAAVTVGLTASITSLSGTVPVSYLSGAARPTVGSVKSHWQNGAQQHEAFGGSWQDAAPLPVECEAQWQDGLPLSSAMQGAWTDADRLARNVGVRYEQALPVGTWATASSFQQGLRVKAAVEDRFSEALRVATWPVETHYQEAYRDRRRFVAALFQEALGVSAGFSDRESYGVPTRTPLANRYQDARRPPIGMWVRPVVPPAVDPCYVPELPVRLIFTTETGTGLPLVFVCERHLNPDPDPGGTIVVPIKEVYLTVNSATLVRVSSGDVIPTYRMSLSLDVDSWTWSFSATVPGAALDAVQPSAYGEPVEVQATINSVPYRFVVESISRERTHAATTLSISGRGIAAVLDAPYSPVLNFGNEFDRTAQQLIADILTDNGVPMDWTVNWNPTDWLVPAGVFSHTGTYMSAVRSVVGAVDGVIRPHNTLQEFDVLLRYPTPSWEWASATPDFELPAAVTTREGLSWADKALYNRVFVSGQEHGVNGRYTRTGTDGGLLAPPVVDPLITHVDAVRQRGRSILSDTGRVATVSLRLPVLSETGIIKPGNFVRYTDGAIERIGMSRSVGVEVALPTIYQTIEVETHVEPV